MSEMTREQAYELLTKYMHATLGKHCISIHQCYAADAVQEAFRLGQSFAKNAPSAPVVVPEGQHVAFLRYQARHERAPTIHLCDSDAEGAFPVYRAALAAPQPAQSEDFIPLIHAEWCKTLIAALKKLSFAAQTTGGTAGPDAGLQEAISEAERAMSFAGGFLDACKPPPTERLDREGERDE